MLLSGAVLAHAWTDDSQRICGAGEGKDFFAKAVAFDTGSKVGDLLGPSKSVLCAAMKQKPYRLVLGSENQGLYVFDGVPFKAAKSLDSAHSNFITSVAFNKAGSQFLSASLDKSFAVYDAASCEVLAKVDKAHAKGVMDAMWIDDIRIATCSTDGTVKLWEEAKELKVMAVDENEKVDNQQMGLLAKDQEIISVGLNSDIYIWSLDEAATKPT
mmetsp:Transcript_3605/g.2655  ORF Transcript_3605/g.2655 Transcript_3605/m.2655 type:complete len:214 (-) Transcript_3605:903-1544(-)